jgi:hypothetical protein
MADFEELRISVKVADDSSKKLDEIKRAYEQGFGGAANVENLGRLFRHVGNIDRQIKELTEGIARGTPFTALTNFVATFGLVGAAIKVAYDVAKTTFDTVNKQAGSIVDLAFAARQANVHPAQLQREIEQARGAGIGRERMMDIAKTLNDRIGDLRTGDPKFREELRRNLSGPQADLVNQLVDKIIAAPQPERLNLIMQGERRIRQYYLDHNQPELAESQSEAWLRWWTGGVDLARMKSDFEAVSARDMALMDKMIEASDSWVKVTADMASNFDKIIGLVTVQVMNDPVLGTLVRFSGAFLGAMREQLEADQLGKPPQTMPWWYGPRLGPRVRSTPGFLGVPRWLDLLARTLRRLHEQEKQQGSATEPQRLMGGASQDQLEKQNDYTAELVEQFRRFNALLSGEEKPLPDLAAAAGLNDISTKTPNLQGVPGGPGGTVNNDLSEGAFSATTGGTEDYNQFVNAAHSRAQSPSDALATVHEYSKGIQRQITKGILFPGAPEGRQVVRGSVFGQFPEFLGSKLPGGWIDPDDMNKKTGKWLGNFAGYGQDVPGVALPYAAAAGQAEARKGMPIRVWDLNRSEHPSYLGHVVDVGPNQSKHPSKDKGIDINAPLAETMGYRGVQGGRALLARQKAETGRPAFPDPGQFGYEVLTPQRFLRAQHEVQQEEAHRRGEQIPLHQARISRLDPSILDRALGTESGVEASGNLNVRVSAPAGTEVKASGEGMFANNVSLERQMQLPTLQ